ncbi:MAG: asparagine synthase (glutamine-hydrolyzing) [Candidatus Margulisbacteria bacterium]|nr:asparagine synthase (glutamine-hydrolyzing) [Candidatus Margulisiibacteriota bacterium]
MCGLAGIYSLNGLGVDPRDVRTMCDRLAHRGPDDEGYVFFGPEGFSVAGGQDTPETIYASKTRYAPSRPINQLDQKYNLALGHRRLSIIDLTAAGHQPMSTGDGLVWVVFNGEIYNYLEIRKELESLGHVFHSTSDTEVLLNAYLEWSTDCLKKFNGMWSFVIYDKRQNILFAARDRFGVKPFYYYLDNNYFAFASEIKALVSLPFYKKEINEKAVFAYLVLQVEEQEPEGFFKNIYDLTPSHYLIYDLGRKKIALHRYYSLAVEDNWEKYDPRNASSHVESIRKLIFDAVKIRLRSDVPVGSCLSGGLDSSAIVSVINRIGNHSGLDRNQYEQKSFTACFNSSKDESKYASRIADEAKATWYKVFPDAAAFLNDLESLIYYQDIPFCNGSTYAEYRVMGLAHEQKIKVLMNGQGGDEIFSGYPNYYMPFFAEILKRDGIFEFMRMIKNIENAPVDKRYIITNLIKSALSHYVPFEMYAFQFRKKYLICSYLNDDFWRKHIGQLVEPQKARFKTLNEILVHNLTRTNMKTLLRMTDRNSMRFSVEVRSPFVDDINLTDYMFSVPANYKMHEGWSKYLLREAMAGIMPEAIRLRKDKIGFEAPDAQWLRQLKNELKGYLGGDLKEYFKADKLSADWDGIINGSNFVENSRVWRIINFAVWRKVYKI